MKPTRKKIRLQLLPLQRYVGVDEKDPIKFYRLPVIGRMYQQRIELCLEQLTGGQSVLEVGFGSGVSFLNLSQLYQEIHGLDLTADVRQVGEMFASLGIQTELRNGSVLEMPYPDQSFDSVLLISILEHLQPYEQHQAFREIWRVLKPGGQVVYGVPVERPLMVFCSACWEPISASTISPPKQTCAWQRKRFSAQGTSPPCAVRSGCLGKCMRWGNIEKTDSFQTFPNS